jgi:autotransporter translocation and assembly factor TamB
MKRALLGLLLVLCVVVVALWAGRAWLTDVLRTRLEIAVARASGMPCRVEKLAVAFLPVRLTIHGATVGAADEPIVGLDELVVDLDAAASLVEWRPVVAAHVSGVVVDLVHLPERPMDQTHAGLPALPPLRIEAFDVAPVQMRFPMDHTSGDLRVERLAGSLETGRLVWGVTGKVEIAGVELARTAHRVRVEHVRIAGGVNAGGLFVSEGTLTGEAISASVTATSTTRRYAASARFDPSVLGVIVDELAFIGGTAQAEGILEGDLANPVFDGTLQLQRGAIAEHVLGDLAAHVARSGTNLRFDDIRLHGTAGGEVSGRVDLDIHDEVPIESVLTWDAVDLEQLLAVIGVNVPFRTAVTGATTNLRGMLDPLDLDIAAMGTLAPETAGASGQAAHWQASARVRPHDLNTRLELSQAQNRVAAEFRLAGHQLGGGLTLAAPDLATLSLLLPAPVMSLALGGQADGTAGFSGTTEQPALAGQVRLRQLTVVGTRVPEAAGDFAITPGLIRSERTVVDTPAGRAEFSGDVALTATARNDWTLTLRDVNTDLAVGLLTGFTGVQTPLNGGTLAGSVQCRERWEGVDLQANLAARWLRIGPEPLERVEAEFTARVSEWTLRLRATHAENESITVDASGRGGARVDLAVDSTPITLARWQESGLAGRLDLNGRLSGDPTRLDGVLELSGSELAYNGRQLGNASVRAAARGGEWHVDGRALGGALTLSGTVGVPPQLPCALTLAWNEAQLAPLLSDSESLSIVSTGELAVGGVLTDLSHVTGALQAPRLDIGEEQYQLHVLEPIRIDMANGTFRIRSFQMEGAGSRIVARGDWTVAGDMRLDVEGEGDLMLLELLNERVESARGTFSLSAQVRKAPQSDWDLRGRASVTGMTLDLGLPVVFAETNGTLALSGSRLRIETLGGKAGGGEFAIGGFIDLDTGPALTWRVKEVSLNLPEWLEERVSGEGRVTGSRKVIRVSGDIEVVNALYDRDIELTDLLPWFRERLAPVAGRKPAATEVRLDLRLHAPGGLFVDNNYVKAEMAAKLRVTGTTGNPVLNGTVEVLSGEVTFRDREFTVTGGTIDFRDPFRINPVLSLEAETRVSTSEGEYIVVASVTGTADAPRIQLSSDDPGLTQNDLLALIAAGKTSAQLQRESTGFSPGSLLSLLPTGGVEQEVRNVTGLDRFEISSERMQDTSVVPRVTIGKDLTDRLRATVSSTLVETYQTVTLEYRLTRRLSVSALWLGQTKSQAGAVGGGGKLRYDFRGSPFSLLRGLLPTTTKDDAE